MKALKMVILKPSDKLYSATDVSLFAKYVNPKLTKEEALTLVKKWHNTTKQAEGKLTGWLDK